MRRTMIKACQDDHAMCAESQTFEYQPGTRHGMFLVFIAIMSMMLLAGMLSGCGANAGEDSGGAADDAAAAAQNADYVATEGPPEIAGLTYEEETPLERAEGFHIYRYEGGYSLIDITGYQRFLVIPEGGEVPAGLAAEAGVAQTASQDQAQAAAKDSGADQAQSEQSTASGAEMAALQTIVCLQQPVDRIYLAATATMALFCSMDALDHIRMSSIKESAWTFEEPRKAMQKGDILYAGKYSAPDYETLLDEECDLAIESTMIDHTPEVKEMIEEVDIPVLVDRSSYEDDPMGRAEWIKLYAAITGTEKAAEDFFSQQLKSIQDLDDFENTDKTVAFFYITSDGKAVARASSDYVPKMIQIAGGKYIFSDLTSDDNRSSVDMSVETFFDTAADADFIVYNTSIDGSVKTLADLTAKDPIMANMKAVQEGNCWAIGSSMYQRTDLAAEMILDFHKLLTEEDPADLKYIEKLQ